MYNKRMKTLEIQTEDYEREIGKLEKQVEELKKKVE